MITEIVFSQGQFELITYRVVAVEDYGSEGSKPIFPKTDCPLAGPDDSFVSCVGGSGSSCCGGYMGHAGSHVVRCHEPMKETQ